MRSSKPPVQYLVGTPKGRLSALEQALVDQPWHTARHGAQVKLLPQDGELYVLAESTDRVAKNARYAAGSSRASGNGCTTCSGCPSRARPCS